MSQQASQVEVTSVEETELPKEHYDTLEEYINGLQDKKGSLINVLHKAQELFGYLPKEVQLFIARKLDIPGAKVFGVVSFYSYFTQTPVGKHKISMCMGTACYVTGAEKILEEFKKELSLTDRKTSDDGQFTLRDVRCIGACGLAPVVFVDDHVYGHLTVDSVKQILDKYREENEDAN